MHEYLFDIEAVRLAIILGVVVTMLFYERLQLTTGGAIVPGYLALFVSTPLLIGMTLLMAYLTYFVVNHVLAKRYILYGRAKFEIEIITGLVFVSISSLVAFYLVDYHPYLVALYGIGFVIPGVLAHDMFRQKPHKTILAVLVNTGIVVLVIFIFQALLRVAPWYTPAAVPPLLEEGFSYPIRLLLPAVVVSVGIGVVLFRKLELRTGGFVTGAYLALVLLRPADVLFALVVGIITFLFVTKVMMPRMMLFGRRKFSVMVLMGALFAWAAEILLRALTDGAYVPWSGFHIIALMIPGLLANDAQRQGLPRTLAGTALSTVTVFLVMLVVARLVNVFLPA